MTTIPTRLLDDLMDAADAVADDIGGPGGKWLDRSTLAINEYLGRGPDPNIGPFIKMSDSGKAVPIRPCEIGDCRVIYRFASENSFSLLCRGYCANCQTHLGDWYADARNATLDIDDHLKERRS